jgi:hypothetical protein
MCFSKKSKSSQETKTSLSPWSQNEFTTQRDDIFNFIDDFNTNQPYKPYTGQMVADLSGREQQARDYASANLGSTTGLFGDAEDLIRTGAGMEWNPDEVAGPERVDFRTYNPGDEDRFYNEFEDDVVNSTSALFDEDLGRKRSDLQSEKTLRGSYGGSRHGIADAELMRTSAMDKASLLANLKYQGHNDSLDRFERESQGVFGADTFNATGDYNARRDNAVRQDDASRYNIENKYTGAGLLDDLAGDKQDSWMREVDLMDRLGMSDRQIEDAKLLAERAQYDEAAAEEWRRMQLELQTRIGLLGATPMLVNSTGTSTSKVSDPMGSITGLLTGIGSLGSGIGAFGSLLRKGE